MGGTGSIKQQLEGDIKEQIEMDEGGVSLANLMPNCDINETTIAMVGPWGGRGGSIRDIQIPGICLNSITIRSGELVYALAFSYSDGDGKQNHRGPWGASWGACDEFIDDSFNTIHLAPSEFLTAVSGTSDFSSRYGAHVVTSVTFISNAHTYGPFGGGGGKPFHSPVMTCGSIVGIFARTAKVVDAIGLYVKSEKEPMKKRDLITKVGPWGGDSGMCNDLVVLPRRLMSVVVRSADVIYSLAFTYCDGGGQQHSAGPWGGWGASQDAAFHTIIFGPSEFLKQVSGKIGPSSEYPDVLTSLLFVTNIGNYGPFGGGRGVPFCCPVQENGSIVGFFAHVGKAIHAIGVYAYQQSQEDNDGSSSATSDLQGDITELDKECNMEVVPSGGYKGNVKPLHLNNITIRSGAVVYSFEYSYNDEGGKLHREGPWGTRERFSDESVDMIQLEPSEFLTEVSGTIGFTTLCSYDAVTSIMLITNVQRYGPFGGGGGIPFHSPTICNGCIVGFYTHGERVIDAIGIYVNLDRESKIEQISIQKIGPWGGDSGMPDDADLSPRRLKSVILHRIKTRMTMIGPWGGRGGAIRDIKVPSICLNNITIRSGELVYAIAFSYSDCDGKQHHGGPWGASWGSYNEFFNDSFNTIQLGPSEFLTEVSGTSDYSPRYVCRVVTSVTFITNRHTYGPFGGGGGIPFRSPSMNCGSVVGIFARTGKIVHAIGLYVNLEEEPMKKRDLITKVGPWGGDSGTLNDLVVLPRRLISVVIRSGHVIDSIAFTYSDNDGQQYSAGPWGGWGASQDATFHTILFGPSEFLKQVSGNIGPSSECADVLTSLVLITNTGKYGPFGKGGGIPFDSLCSIVGFFAHVGKVVHAIGVYADRRTQEDNNVDVCSTSELQGLTKELHEASITKVGPWGGHKGNPNDLTVVPLHLNSITIRIGEVIYSIAFSYTDEYGKLHHAGPWGACKGFSYGSFETIILGPSEFVTEVSGTVGFSTLCLSDVVTSIKFITNARTYGPFGEGGGITFRSPAMSNGCIVGFFANAEGVVDAIGLYMNPVRESKTNEDSVTKIGPWGGSSGISNDLDILPRRLKSVELHSGEVINSLTFTYRDCDEQEHTVGPWGREPLDGSLHTILLGESEFLIEVSGTIGKSSLYVDVVTSLLFFTNTCSYGPYGKGRGTPFRSPLHRNGSIIGFFAIAGDVIDAIGVYFSHEKEKDKDKVIGGSRISNSSNERALINSASNVLEQILIDESAKPVNLPLALLQKITDNFSENKQIGHGAFGIVYKGDLQNGSVAIKKLLYRQTKVEKKMEPFDQEATYLISVKHINIVRFLGYCGTAEKKAMMVQESPMNCVFGEIQERLLCFEYIDNGSLDIHLTDELSGLEWHTRFEIIRGICDGLVYLHRDKDIVHMDMKPGNILLNKLMIPKITDFGISKFLEGKTHFVTTHPVGTQGYTAPEYRNQGIISIKTDIYSIGVIIKEIVTGSKENPDIKHVLRKWRYRWNKSGKNPPLGYEQVTTCIEIVSRCLLESPNERPYAWDIVSILKKLENTDEHVNNSEESSVTISISPYPWELLEFDLLELRFPFEMNKQIPCSLQLTNATDDYVAFDIEWTGVLEYCVHPEKGVVSPRSKCNVTVALQARERKPHSTTCKDDCVIVRCTAVDESLAAEDITIPMFHNTLGKLVDEVILKVIVEP